MQLALANDQLEMLEQILEYTILDREEARELFCNAVLWDMIPAARLLLKHGADIEARDEYGCSPLHLAAIAGNDEGVRFLLFRAPISRQCKSTLTAPVQMDLCRCFEQAITAMSQP